MPATNLGESPVPQGDEPCPACESHIVFLSMSERDRRYFRCRQCGRVVIMLNEEPARTSGRAPIVRQA